MTGDKFFNTGDFRGANVFQKSIIDRIDSLKGTDISSNKEERANLDELFDELKRILSTVPNEHQESAEAVAAIAEAFVAEAKNDDSNKTLLKVFGGTFKTTAKKLASAAPLLITNATKIVDLIAKIKGLS